MRARLLLAAAPTALLVSSVAHADGATINPGLLVSAIAGPRSHGTTAIGGEASVMFWPEDKTPDSQIGFGGFAQAQRYSPGFGRYAIGAQVGSILGAELGFAHRDAGPRTLSSNGAHVGVFASLGLFVFAFRSTVPIANGEGHLDAPGPEFAFVFALKLPIPVGGVHLLDIGMQGRLLRSGDTVIAPEVTVVQATGLAGEHARRWARDGACELASVPAFVRLAEELRALGAPPSLVRRALGAAIEEVGHTEACFRLASHFAGHPVAPGAMREPAPRMPSLETIAVEALVDGVHGEGAAARKAAEELALERDPLVREVLALITREEASHARLSQDVLAWAESVSGRRVRHALRRADLPFVAA